MKPVIKSECRTWKLLYSFLQSIWDVAYLNLLLLQSCKLHHLDHDSFLNSSIGERSVKLLTAFINTWSCPYYLIALSSDKLKLFISYVWNRNFNWTLRFRIQNWKKRRLTIIALTIDKILPVHPSQSVNRNIKQLRDVRNRQNRNRSINWIRRRRLKSQKKWLTKNHGLWLTRLMDELHERNKCLKIKMKTCAESKKRNKKVMMTKYYI